MNFVIIQKIVIQIYKPYWLWEDFLNGFYNTSFDGNLDEVYEFMCNVSLFELSMIDVVINWPNSMLHNLTNSHINRIAYIGQCAVNYKMRAPSLVTKCQWKLLPSNIQKLANESARIVLNLWIDEYQEKNK